MYFLREKRLINIQSACSVVPNPAVVSCLDRQQGEPYKLRERNKSRSRLSSAHTRPRLLDFWLQRQHNQASLCPLNHSSALMLYHSFETALSYPFNEFPCTFFFFATYLFSFSLSASLTLSRLPLGLGEPLAALVSSLITLLLSPSFLRNSH